MERDPRHNAPLQNLRGLVRMRMRRQAPGLAYDFTHIERVWRNARILARHAETTERWQINGDVLEAACLLHEMGRGTERPGEHHCEASARAAEALLRQEGLDNLVWPVCDTILSHEPEGGRSPRTPEAKLLRDADLLEMLGAIGIARAVMHGSFNAVPALYDSGDPVATEREPDPVAYLLDSFPSVLFKVNESMQTAFGRTEAERRTRIVRAFYKAILQEAGFDV